MLVAEDSVKAVWYYKEVHELTVGIIVAGCTFLSECEMLGILGLCLEISRVVPEGL